MFNVHKVFKISETLYKHLETKMACDLSHNRILQIMTKILQNHS